MNNNNNNINNSSGPSRSNSAHNNNHHQSYSQYTNLLGTAINNNPSINMSNHSKLSKSSPGESSHQSPSSTHSSNHNNFDIFNNMSSERKESLDFLAFIDPNNHVISPLSVSPAVFVEEKEPASLDSLELPEISNNNDVEEEEDTLKRKSKGNSSTKIPKKARFRPCDACRKRKSRCVIPENKRACIECTKRNQACEYDSEKIFLFNNVNALSGVTKLIKQKSNDGSKSQRTKPCDACKKKRSKCIKHNNSSSCLECEKKNTICTYSQNLLTSFPSTGKVNLISNATNNDLNIQKPVKDYSLLNEPTVMTSSLSLLNSKSTTIIGENAILEKKLFDFKSTNENESLQIIKNPISHFEDGNKVLRKLNNQAYFQIVDDVDDFINLKYLQCDEIEEIVQGNSNYLINLYFKLVHPTLPILSKEAFFERYCRNYREIHPILLVSVYLLALNWWELDSNEFEAGNASESFTKTENKPNVAKLELIAISLMQDNLFETPKFSILQSFLLLSNYSFLNSNNPFNTGSVWKIMSMMSAYAEEIGLNWPSDKWDNIPLWERKVRKIIGWAVVFHDKLYSLFEGRSTNIDLENNWLLDRLEYNDFLIDDQNLKTLEKNELMFKNKMYKNMITNEAFKELEISKNERVDLNNDKNNKFISKHIFIETMNLSTHIDEVLSKIYSLKSIKNDDFDTIYEKCILLVDNLKNWFDGLPDVVKLVHDNTNTTNVSIYPEGGSLMLLGGKTDAFADYKRFSLLSNGSLNFLYYTIILLIYKRLVNKYIDYFKLYQFNNDLKTFEVIDKFKDTKVQIKEIINTVIYKFLFNLKPYNLESFWLLNTRRSFIFMGIIMALLVKSINLEIERLKQQNASNISSPFSENNSPASSTTSPSYLKPLLVEKNEIINYYRDFRWKLNSMAPDFNHARVALRYLDNLIVLQEHYKKDGSKSNVSNENTNKSSPENIDNDKEKDSEVAVNIFDDENEVEPSLFVL